MFESATVCQRLAYASSWPMLAGSLSRQMFHPNRLGSSTHEHAHRHRRADRDVSDDEGRAAVERAAAAQRAVMRSTTDRERYVIERDRALIDAYAQGVSMYRLAKETGLSRPRVQQICNPEGNPS